jgi:hypothetical protein
LEARRREEETIEQWLAPKQKPQERKKNGKDGEKKN